MANTFWDKLGTTEEELPGPLQRLLSSTGVKVANGQPFTGSNKMAAIASVDQDSPDTIEVEDWRKFKSAAPQLLAHEAVHLMQNNLAPTVAAGIPADNPADPYNYGGEEGLKAMRAAGKKLWQLPREQAAAITQYYVAQGGENAPRQIQQVYGPWIEDMNSAPLSTILPTEPGQQGINVEPRPPQAVPETYQATETYGKGDPAPGADDDSIEGRYCAGDCDADPIKVDKNQEFPRGITAETPKRKHAKR